MHCRGAGTSQTKHSTRDESLLIRHSFVSLRFGSSLQSVLRPVRFSSLRDSRRSQRCQVVPLENGVRSRFVEIYPVKCLDRILLRG